MKSFFILIILAAGFSYECRANICNRTPQIVGFYEGRLQKKCDVIEREDLKWIWPYFDNYGLTSLADGDFDGVYSEKIVLQNNDIKSLPGGVFRGAAFDMVIIWERSLSSLQTSTFSGLSMRTALNYIDISDSQIETLPKNLFSGVTALHTVHLHRNEKLLSISEEVFSNSTIERLNLEYNNLTSLDSRSFQGMPKLVVIRLSGNPLTKLPAGLFDNLPSLEWIIANGTNITDLPYDFFDKIPNLKAVQFSGNKLTEIQKQYFKVYFQKRGIKFWL